MAKSTRLDEHIYKQGLCESVEEAARKIITGWALVNGETVRDPSKKISGAEKIKIARPGGEFASRGGDKLKKALDLFNIDVQGKTAADLGSSTGGFTDCLLKYGARRIYCVDVGYGILDYRLRNDEKITVMERTNVRDLKKEDFHEKINFITVDLSFISILKVFNKIEEIFSPVEGIILIKPQFEASPEEHIKGVVGDKENHQYILKRVIDSLIKDGMTFKGLTFSPLKGPAGNIEFLLHFQIEVDRDWNVDKNDIHNIIDIVVKEAHNKL